MFPRIFSAAILIIVSGCVSLAPIEREPVRAQVLASTSKDRLVKNSEIEIRTFLPGDKPNTRGSEVVGAKCTLVSDELRATIVTPQKVIVPTFKQRANIANRGVPSGIVVRCSSGKLNGQALVTAQQKSASTTVGGGVAAAILTTMVTAAIATSTPWVYAPAVNVLLQDN